MQLRKTILAAVALVTWMALMAPGEDSCKYYVKIFEIKEMECEMECFLRYGQDPVCKTGVMNAGQCHIETQYQQMCIKWPVSTSITCRNNTYSEEMKGTEQDCAADQESLDCMKEFNSNPNPNPNQRGEQEGDKSSAPAIKAAWVTFLWGLILVVINAWN
ncbi:hypothetical protein ANANG_G00046030 [Anguilla anguilla]|uniref:Uncharacterized protein n=1 Tax=Anguilla anguilla TaxID=7936 RepID=A0A9D3MUF3_ANGAN|nr:hypothetical protein ANANG_G00046030 [Anguilla anguilla]